jgi:hypothetical protein
MNTNDVTKHYGTAAEARRQLGVSRQLYQYWQKKGIPMGRQYEIQFKTDNALHVTAEVPAPQEAA